MLRMFRKMLMIETKKNENDKYKDDDEGSILRTSIMIVVHNPMDAAITLVTSRNGRFQWT